MAVQSPPSAIITTPAEGARYTRGRIVDASYSCQDAADSPGIASCTGTVPSGGPLDTLALGQHTFTATATSSDGQAITRTISYTIVLPDNHFTISHLKILANGITTFWMKVPGPGKIGVLESAWNDNLATIATTLRPGSRRFVVASNQATTPKAMTLHIRLADNARGGLLIAHHTYRVTLRLWVS